MPDGARVACGRHAVRAALSAGKVTRVAVARGSNDDLAEAARRAGVPVREADRAWLDRAAGTGKHQSVVAWCRPAGEGGGWRGAVAESASPLLLVLDRVEDPRNLGACLRTAAAMGVDAVVTPSRNSAALTPAARKVAAGAEEVLPVTRVTNLARELRAMRAAGLAVVGADPQAGEDVFRGCPAGPLALVLGGEARGMRRLTRECCDLLLSVPMPGAGAVASLNVSVACGICLAAANLARKGAGG